MDYLISFKSLKKILVIIEHDPEILSYCDYLIKLGPKGGRIIAEGTPKQIKMNKKSNTGLYLN